jgi:hypothetical protein
MRNSFISLSEQIVKLNNNSLQVLAALSEITSSNENEVRFEITDEKGAKNIISFPSVGFLLNEVNTLKQSLNTLTSVDQRGAIIHASDNQFKKIIVSDLNREPNSIGELGVVNTFASEKNWFFDSLLNPILKVRIDLSNKIESNVRKILSRRYIVRFDVDSSGGHTPAGQKASDLFSEVFKNRSNITVEELEKWLLNTPGVRPNKHGSKVEYDEQEFDIEPNRLKYEGFFTVLSTDEDFVNKKMWFLLDTIEYTDIATKAKHNLQIGDEVIVNMDFSTTRYKVAEINKDSSDIKVRFEVVEGSEPIPVSVIGGLKYYSPVVENKNVDISIGFDEHNVVFVKAINTDNHLIARRWSAGVAFYTNDLKLISDNNLGDNGKSMTEYYIEAVHDYSEVLKDMVNRQIPRHLGLTPPSPVLNQENFTVKEVNKHVTETSDIAKNRKRHETITTLRSKLDNLSKSISEKRKEFYSKTFASPKDRVNVQNQIDKLVSESESVSQELNSVANEIIANNINDASATPKYKVLGFWNFPEAIERGKTKPQNVIAFRVQYKYSSIDNQENSNEVFKVVGKDGKVTNAVYSPWAEYVTNIRERVYDVATQKWTWGGENLSDIDKPNVNSLAITINPNEKVSIRIRSISEVGYPDALLESEWSNVLEMSFDPALLKGSNPQEMIIKNAELESIRNKIQADLDRKNVGAHLSDAINVEGKYYPHVSSNIAFKDVSGKYISLDDRLKQLEQSENLEPHSEAVLINDWVNYGDQFEHTRFYKHGGRVYISGVIRVDKGSSVSDWRQRFLDVEVSETKNSQYSIITRVPDAYAPLKKERFLVSSANGGTATVDITPDGFVTLVKGQSSSVSLSGISYRIV